MSKKNKAKYLSGLTLYNGEKLVINQDGIPLPLFLKELNKSPTGFNWGYNGSGPAQLAYAICRLFCSKKIALLVFQDFKKHYISHMPKDSWIFGIEELEERFRATMQRQEVS